MSDFKVFWTNEAQKTYVDLEGRAIQAFNTRKTSGKSKSSDIEGLFKQVRKTIDFLSANPRHSGLKTHEYSSIASPYRKGDKVFEAYVQNNTPGAYRVFWCYGPEKSEITIIAITPHP
jgi:hypothetical protein